MTAKEKAEELVEKFHNFLQKAMGESASNIYWQDSKQCALIAVDEIIEYINTVWFKPEEVTDNNFNYWQEVKNEIERL